MKSYNETFKERKTLCEFEANAKLKEIELMQLESHRKKMRAAMEREDKVKAK
eukprot:CAMPEP_0170545836 /NCGR_PEP_ID=MMETSP0211-20121228/4201_1 /TAXON_ID=311385 /ORGANISM="Pseudokeronopsis sp., Strain OXSARD2" /LENGTH=51 /DNA_ID=CAMNT_0010849969 /DNA_START=2080 /DNA_END=2235 /DNA_ORIENTATION=-